MATVSAILFSGEGAAPLEPIDRWLAALNVPVVALTDVDALMSIALRSRPRVVVFDARNATPRILDALRRLKSDSYTGMVPAVALVGDDSSMFQAAFEAGADEVIRNATSPNEIAVRLAAVLHRSDRDLYVHPSTRLPGAMEIEGEIGRRLESGALFAVCYADLDHFKEFNDRYSYHDGDRVIRILSRRSSTTW